MNSATMNLDLKSTPLYFLLGNHRSGTTWLYQLLAESGHFSVLTAWHVIEWDRISRGDPPPRAELAERMSELGIARRQVDNVVISPGLPEEYCYILANAGKGSALTSANRPLLDAIIARLASEQPGRPVLLKNPWDYGNFLTLAREYPQARFIFLHRHPLRVIHSAIQVTCALWAGRPADEYVLMLSKRYAMWRRNRLASAFFNWLTSGSLGILARMVAFTVTVANRAYAERVPSFPASRWIELKYEDLAARPDQELARILGFVGVEPPAGIQTASRAASGTLRVEVAALGSSLARNLALYYSRMGYGPKP